MQIFAPLSGRLTFASDLLQRLCAAHVVLGICQARAKPEQRRSLVVLVSPTGCLAHAEVVKVNLVDVLFVVHCDGKFSKQQ
eukprot:COSAG02_NODE_11976_length_1621_cov_2.099869_1_plen_81_part_00